MKTKLSLISIFIFSVIISVAQNNMEIKEIATMPTENPQEEIYNIVDYMPEFPGGSMEMMKFIQKNIVYPKNAREKNISGKLFLKYIINADGTISDIKILKGVSGCPECDEEGVRVVKLMPKWKPGMQAGKPVPVYWNLPINFTLTGK